MNEGEDTRDDKDERQHAVQQLPVFARGTSA
jgi:hypothetical protein